MKSESLYNNLKSELMKIKSFHSVSPQHNFYSSKFITKLDKLLYDSEIDSDYYRFLRNELFSVKDTSNIHTFIGIGVLFNKYKPRLGELDLLYSTDLSTIKMLKDLSEGICSKLGKRSVFCPELTNRINYIISNIQKCSDTLEFSSKEVYYRISILKNSILMAGKVHPSKYLNDLCELYSELYNKVIINDLDFYTEFQNSFNEDGTKLKTSSLFSNIDDEYNYTNYLLDYNNVLCKLSCSQDAGPKIDSTNNSIYNSNMSRTLKDKCSNDLFRLRTEFINNLVSISAPYYWYNEVQDDFVYHCTPSELEEGYDVGSCICQLVTFESLVEYAVQTASLMSLASDRDKNSFNESLHETLFKLYKNDMMENYLEVYKEFKQ